MISLFDSLGGASDRRRRQRKSHEDSGLHRFKLNILARQLTASAAAAAEAAATASPYLARSYGRYHSTKYSATCLRAAETSVRFWFLVVVMRYTVIDERSALYF